MKTLKEWLDEKQVDITQPENNELDNELLESQLEQLCVRVHGLVADCPTDQKNRLLNKFIETLKASRVV